MRGPVPAAAPGWLVLALILTLCALVGWLAWPTTDKQNPTVTATDSFRAPRVEPDDGTESWNQSIAIAGQLPDAGREQVDLAARTTTSVRTSRAKTSPGAGEEARRATRRSEPTASGGDRTPGTATDEMLLALADCESGDHDGKPPYTYNPQAVSRSGRYVGAFQWSRPSWDRHVARMGRLDLVGVYPHTLTYEEQRDITRAVPVSAWRRQQFPRCARLLGFGGT